MELLVEIAQREPIPFNWVSDVTILGPQLAAVAIAVATGREILPLLLRLNGSGWSPGSPVGDFLGGEPLSSVAPEEDAWPNKEEDRLNRAVKQRSFWPSGDRWSRLPGPPMAAAVAAFRHLSLALGAAVAALGSLLFIAWKVYFRDADDSCVGWRSRWERQLEAELRACNAQKEAEVREASLPRGRLFRSLEQMFLFQRELVAASGSVLEMGVENSANLGKHLAGFQETRLLLCSH